MPRLVQLRLVRPAAGAPAPIARQSSGDRSWPPGRHGSSAQSSVAPSVVLLFIWMIVPLAMTLYFSFLHYNLLNPEQDGFVGFENYAYFLTDPAFLQAILQYARPRRLASSSSPSSPASLLALLIDQPILGQGIVRILVISPFFVMPTGGGAGLEEHAHAPGLRGLRRHRAGVRAAADRLVRPAARCFSVILIVAWQWLPFATLILLTALQSLDEEQKEAAEMDGAGSVSRLRLSDAAAPGPRRSPSSS